MHPLKLADDAIRLLLPGGGGSTQALGDGVDLNLSTRNTYTCSRSCCRGGEASGYAHTLPKPVWCATERLTGDGEGVAVGDAVGVEVNVGLEEAENTKRIKKLC